MECEQHSPHLPKYSRVCNTSERQIVLFCGGTALWWFCGRRLGGLVIEKQLQGGGQVDALISLPLDNMFFTRFEDQLN